MSARRRSSLFAAALAAALAAPISAAHAQATVGGVALDRFEPAPSGDALFGVPSPYAGGHLVPRGMVMFDYADKPLRLLGANETAIVSSQGFLRVDVSLALWNRLLVSFDMPFAVVQSGSDPGTAGVSFNTPGGAALGDLRIGARGRLWGENGAPFQIGVGGYLFAPTGTRGGYAGEGAVRGDFHGVLGGRLAAGPVGIVWSAAGGVMLSGSDNPHQARFGGGAAVVVGRDVFQIGPEIYGATQFGGDSALAATGTIVKVSTNTGAEVLLGAKLRLLGGLLIGAAGGPGLTTAIGTPAFRVLASVGWAPPVGEPAQGAPIAAGGTPGDRDGDGFRDDVDACPDVKGGFSGDPSKDGCPPPDRDQDGILDADDACPNRAGLKHEDAARNGCPLDTDGDGVADTDDACPAARGLPSKDAKKNGCPEDRDGDGVADDVDACPNVKGAASADAKWNGCPDDLDGDGVKGAADACPNEKGVASTEADTNGCPRFVRLTDREIVILKQVEFKSYGRLRSETIDPISADLLSEVRDVINQHPEILKIEVQGHTDDSGDTSYNERLSVERATQVRKWLVDAGIPDAKLTSKGYGSTAPIGDNRIKAGRQKNRRVQFMIVQKR